MTTDAQACAHCEKPTHDGYVCATCTGKLRKLLTELPAAIIDLQTTITKQAKTSSSGARGKGHERSLPFGWSASDDDWAIRNTVLSWARVAIEDAGRVDQQLASARADVAVAQHIRPLIGPVCIYCDHPACVVERARRARIADYPAIVEHIRPTTFHGMVRVIIEHLDWLRQQPFAGEAFDELLSIEHVIRRAVDTRSYRYIGPCTATVAVMRIVEAGTAVPECDSQPPTDPIGIQVSDEVCAADLRLYDGAKLIHCRQCGAEYDAADTELLAELALRDHRATAAIISQAVSQNGRKVSAERIRNWGQRGLLPYTCSFTVRDDTPWLTVVPGERLYRLGDVLDLLAARADHRPLAKALAS